MDSVSTASVEELYLNVDDRKAQLVDITAVLAVAFAPAGAPTPATPAFRPAAWSVPGREVVILVGPGTDVGQLPVGELDAFLAIGTGPRRAVRRAAGGLLVTP